MELTQNTVPARTTLSAQLSIDLEAGNAMKILTPGSAPVTRLEDGPAAGKKWHLAIMISGEETDA